jgi:hypothetical protein
VYPAVFSGDLTRDDDTEPQGVIGSTRTQTRSRYILPGVRGLLGTSTLQDPGFESGTVGEWSQCGTVNAAITSYRAHSGTYAARSGGTISGDSGICQSVTVPPSGSLDFWVYQFSNESDSTIAWQEADLLDGSGNTIDQLYRAVNNSGGWVEKTFDVSSFAGQKVFVYFGVHGDGNHGNYTIQYVDDVSLTGSTNPPSPDLSASQTPVPTPIPVASATPVPQPSATTSGSCVHCGTERWHLKTLVDPEAGSVDFSPQTATVAQLIAISPPGDPHSALPEDQRFGPVELRTYSVEGNLVGWKIEADRDLHIVIADQSDSTKTMIVEVPSDECSGACSSTHSGQFATARNAVITCLGTPTSTFTAPPRPMSMRVTGVGFFDKLHGQTGVAPNAIEIHPTLDVQWLTGGC